MHVTPRSRRCVVVVSPPRHLVRYCVVPQENDTGKRPTSKNLIKGLEENVRKVLETKRNEYDRTHFQLQQKQKELAELQLQLGDLAKDGAALGLDEYPDEQQRLAAIKSISNRKVFTKHTVRGTTALAAASGAVRAAMLHLLRVSHGSGLTPRRACVRGRRIAAPEQDGGGAG